MQINPPLTEQDLHTLAADIQILLMDVDGVLTDGRLYFLPVPTERWSRPRDLIRRMASRCAGSPGIGIKTGVISGRDSPATLERAQQVNMTWVFQGHIEKIPLLEKILRNRKRRLARLHISATI